MTIGYKTYGSPTVHDWGDGTLLNIGKYCSIAAGVNILLGGNHKIDWLSTFPFEAYGPDPSRGKRSSWGKQPGVIVGNDVWIGMNSMFLSGVIVGDGAVIAAGSVVAKDVPPYAVVAGNPANIVKYRFDEETIAKFTKMQWWDWSDEHIAAVTPILQDSDINALYDYYVNNIQ